MTKRLRCVNNTTMIRTENLTKKFGSFTAVNNINLQVPAGTIFGFLGPNGAGKTTTIRMLTGLTRPSAGGIYLDNQSILSGDFLWKKKIGVVSDQLALFEGLTIRDHIRMIGHIYTLTTGEIRTRGDELLRFFNLWEEQDIYVKESSHGMRKKLALALALIHKPKILFLDEALSGIDPVTGSQIRKLLKRLAGNGTTLFITSHTLEVVEQLIDQFVIISKGRIVYCASRDELTGSGFSLEETFVAKVAPDLQLPELAWLF